METKYEPFNTVAILSFFAPSTKLLTRQQLSLTIELWGLQIKYKEYWS